MGGTIAFFLMVVHGAWVRKDLLVRRVQLRTWRGEVVPFVGTPSQSSDELSRLAPSAATHLGVIGVVSTKAPSTGGGNFIMPSLFRKRNVMVRGRAPGMKYIPFQLSCLYLT